MGVERIACVNGSRYISWKNEENIHRFLSTLKHKYNLNTPEEWNSITTKQIQSHGGWGLLKKYSVHELKCMACPEGKLIFNNPKQASGYWEKQENILNFLSLIKEKYNLNTPEDWNSITTAHIQSNGGSRLLANYSMYELKCLACPEGKSIFNNPNQSSGFWENQENIYHFLLEIQGKYNLNTPEDWNSITTAHIQSNGGNTLLAKYSMYELKCMACPEGKSIFTNPPQASENWDNKEHILQFLSKIKEKYNLNTPEDWNFISTYQIQCNGGWGLLSKYSLYELKCMGCPEGKSIFNKPNQSPGYWKNQENILNFLFEIQQKYNLNTPEDWNSITQKHIQSNGGSTLLAKYSMYELKCMACPDGKSIFKKPNQNTENWRKNENIHKFLSEIKEKYNLNTSEDWNSITQKHIQSNGGSALLAKYSMYELKCMACPEGKSMFKKSKQSSGFWAKKENIEFFISKIKKLYNLNTPEDWNSITQNQIQSNGGSRLLAKYSMYELKCMACPEGKSIFDDPKETKPAGYWENEENILKFLSEIKEKYNFNTPEDWNLITQKHILSNGGSSLFNKYSMYELKCMACPEGKSIFNKPNQSPGYWENKENIDKFFSKLKEKYNLNTPEDWNSITQKHIQSNGGRTLLPKYSMYELKCMACPDGKSIFTNPPQSSGYWETKENILQFLYELKSRYNLNTPEDWNLITTNQIQSNGGSRLLAKYSIYELKCMACPEGKSIFNKPKQSKPSEYWEDETNRNQFFLKLKSKYHLHSPLDWKRLSQSQIISQGGNWLFNGKNDYSKIKIQFESPNKDKITSIPIKELITDSISKRSSQRWLFLQVQKLFPNDEIVEDYFHSDISRESGKTVQFDVFMIQRNIAIEYHGKQHYEDIPSGFCNVDAYKYRDIEKVKLCSKHGIQLIIIPYWWDNKLDSLRTTLYSEIS